MKRPRRRRIFVGCEGESERSYVALVGRLIEEIRQDVHLDAIPIGGGGPLAVVKLAIVRRKRKIGQRGVYFRSYIFLDCDKLAQEPQNLPQINQSSQQNNISLVWQDPCFEAILLRHLPGCSSLRPPTAASAFQQLKSRWPEYEKGMPALQLEKRIDREGILRAAAVEPDLDNFLRQIGFL